MTFDRLEFARRPQQVGVSRDQAEAHAEFAHDMLLGEAGTKADVVNLKIELKLEIEKGDQRVVVQLSTVIAAAAGPIVAAQKLL